jgi:ATP-dependent DNA ligase
MNKGPKNLSDTIFLLGCSEKMEFPTLFGEASTGKTKEWSIEVEDRDGVGVIITTHGYTDGKKQTNEKEVTTGKNIGKKNETSPVEQAISEARAAWQKKKDAGYVEAGASTAIETKAKVSVATVPGPMLAHDYNKRGASIKFPCYVQRKYDGTRCVAIPGKGLYSRNKKAYPHMEHILEDIAGLPESLVLDGELYSDELTFQETVGLVKRETLKKGDAEQQKKIRFHVYDIISDKPYEDRWARLQALFITGKFKYLSLVPTEQCDNVRQMKELHGAYVEEGYEGLMLRNKTAAYKVGQRSADLQKYKTFEDDEYAIVGYKEGDGLERGCIIWVCQTKAGQEFACRPRGTREERADLFENGDDYIGKKLTVRYQELTDEGIPRFPVGICVRDYEG